MRPEFNALTIFSTTAFSRHMVEPVWEFNGEEEKPAECVGKHRFALTGWMVLATKDGEGAKDLGLSLKNMLTEMTAGLANLESNKRSTVAKINY